METSLVMAMGAGTGASAVKGAVCGSWGLWAEPVETGAPGESDEP